MLKKSSEAEKELNTLNKHLDSFKNTEEADLKKMITESTIY